jgi:multidrug efflux pump subunit AcrA (membrane-fusion protein)
LAFLDLPLHRRGPDVRGPDVTLSALFAGGMREWRGNIVRVEGEIDERTRMVHAVARVRDPYDREGQHDGMPLAAGMFVNAEIAGHVLQDVIAVPRDGIRGGDRVLVIEPDADAEGTDRRAGGVRSGRLRLREVKVLRRQSDRVLVDGGLRDGGLRESGLHDGDIVCTSPLEIATEGMRVNYVLTATDTSTPGPDSGDRKR